MLTTEANSLLPIQALVRFSLASPAVSSASLGLALLVSDFLHLEVSPFLRESARPELFSSTLSASRPALFPVLDLCTMGSFLLVQDSTRFDLALPSPGNSHLGSSILTFDSLHAGSLVLPQGLAQSGLSSLVVTSHDFDSLLLSKSSSCFGLTFSMLSCSRAELPSSLPDMCSSGVSALTQGPSKVDSPVFVLGMVCTGFPLLLRSPKLGSSMLPFAICRLDSFVFLADIGHLGSALLPRSSGRLDSLVFLSDLTNAGPSSPLHSCMKLDALALFPSNEQLDASISLHNIL